MKVERDRMSKLVGSGAWRAVLKRPRMQHLAVSAAIALLFAGAGLVLLDSSRAAGPYLYASGKDLMYNNQKVVLKGANFDNIGAIGTWTGAGGPGDLVSLEEDYQKLSAHGGNHVRLGMSTRWFIENKAAAYQAIDTQLSYARTHNIWVTLVFFHPYPGDCTENYGKTCPFWTNQSYKDNMRSQWVDIALRYKEEPVIAGYDLLNEPTPPNNDCNAWWPLAQDYRNAIYAVDPNHLVFVESCASSQFWVKLTGNNIVYESHDYSPQAFSHSDVSSTKVYPGYAVDWDGKTRYYDKTAFLTSTDPVLNISQRMGRDWTLANNVPFYIGEWGARSTYTGADKYLMDRAEIYNQWGVNHAFYTWHHDCSTCQWRFGIYLYGKHPLQVNFPEKLAAFKVSVQGAMKPNFLGTVTPPAPPPVEPPASLSRTGWTATASDQSSYDVPGHVLDGSVTTIWHSNYESVPMAPLPHTLTIDMKSSKKIIGLSYLPRQSPESNGNIGQYSIAVSSDGTTWSQPVASGTWTDDKSLKVTSFTAIVGRYVRLTGVTEAGNRGPWSSAAEIEIQGEDVAMTTIPGDVNNDNKVNAIDLSVVLSRDGQNYPAADFNKDGMVGAADLAMLLSKWTW